MSVYEVLTIVELLERILVELPLRNVFAAQRVCRLWRATIEQSSALQVALFLRPPQQDAQAHLQLSRYAFDFPVADTKAAKVISSISTLDAPFVVNPLLQHFCDISTLKTPIGPRTTEVLANPRHHFIQIALALSVAGYCIRVQDGQQGSWRDTYLFASRNPIAKQLHIRSCMEELMRCQRRWFEV